MNDTSGPYQWLRTVLFLPDPASTIAPDIDKLHFFVIATTFVAATLIGLATFWFVIRYRRRDEKAVRTPSIYSTPAREAILVAIPLVFFLTWFVMGLFQFLRIVTPPAGAMVVYVSAKQWMWSFAYPEGPNGLDVLRVPAGRPVRLLLTSRDVIHSFYVPDFRIKQDALPGRYTQTWFEATAQGEHQVFCAEYCGAGHSAMLATLIVMDGAEFDQWMERQRQGLANRQDTPSPQPSTLGSMAEQGRANALRFDCARCHTIDGTAHIGPTWLGLYQRREHLTTGETVVVDEAYLTESMMDPMARIVAGYQPVMPAYQRRLEAPEVASIIEFIKSLRMKEIDNGPSQEPTYEPIPGR